MPRTASFDRDVLIANAREIFWQKGWAGTSMKDLEKGLGLHPGSFYAAFGSKDALYELTLDRYVEEGQARLDQLLHVHGALGALKAYLRSVVEDSAMPVRACMLSKTLLELSGQDNPLASKARQHMATMEARFATLFAQAQKQGEIDNVVSAEKRARRFQSDLMGLRVSAERGDIDALELADEIAADLDRTQAKA
ncbi:MAG: TetR/AcrR family transcriptional regulator [Paracoccaceae bacterium]